MLTLIMAMAFLSCEVDLLPTADIGGVESKGLAIDPVLAYPRVLRIENNGIAYIKASNGSWHQKLAYVKAIDGGIYDLNSGRYWNTFYHSFKWLYL